MPPARTFVFVLKGYPRLSETFIAQEIRALEKLGLAIRIVAMRHPTDGKVHPIHREIRAPVAYLPEYLHDEPGRVLRALWRASRRPGFRLAFRQFRHDLRRDFSRNRIRRMGQAAVLAAEMPDGIAGLHAHFIHTPASVVRYAAAITGKPWSVSAHAKDIWTTADWDLAEKLEGAEWAVTCTQAGLERLNALAPAARPVHLVYHGLDLARFPALLTPRPARDGADAAQPVRILTICRAVEKKGLDTLIAALARLPAGLAWEWVHAGGGALAGKLKEQARALGIAGRCSFRGALDQAEVLALYRQADVFVLPCRIAGDGDRDGLPNVLAEAASQGLALLSTNVSGVPELIEAGVNGLMIGPDDGDALARELERLIREPLLRFRLGRSAMQRVRSAFDHEDTVRALFALFMQGSPIDESVRRAAE
ncbi:MAG: glycosyltransferase family 4 protein [Methylocystis sp.]|nr:glycosyltransferase family 4 protein [Methylocystis sp.]MCA3584992.1 glycosyltransferase family 4 protein [Methylocystis sp.]MCA3586922.1 glycosyltransferase family 4 protein [Methylocystis sp.]MCA3592210.1 glycosyltransferase family 4 protein [Methylocystis sp.]